MDIKQAAWLGREDLVQLQYQREYSMVLKPGPNVSHRPGLWAQLLALLGF